MENKAPNNLPVREWSLAEIFGLVTAAILILAAMVTYWIFEEDSPHLYRSTFIIGIMVGLMGIGLVLLAHYGRNTLKGRSFIYIAVALFLTFVSTARYMREESIAFAAPTYLLGFFAGIAISNRQMIREEKHIINGTWYQKGPFEIRRYLPGIVGFAVLIPLSFALFFVGFGGTGLLPGMMLGMGLHDLVWAHIYEKRKGIRIIIER